MAKKSNPDGQYVDFVDFVKVSVTAKNDEQKNLLKTVAENTITFIKGCPGSGKTYLSVAYALQQFFRKKYERIIFTRPVVEAWGEKLGFLPGTVSEKINPYMIPIFNSTLEMVDSATLSKMTNKNGKDSIIQVIPLAYMRGITFKNSVIVCDEFQNATPEQMRMLITRIGEGSKMVICGDIDQSDIRGCNGLEDAFEILQGIPGIGFVTMSRDSIVRHPIIAEIENRYSARRAQRQKSV